MPENINREIFDKLGNMLTKFCDDEKLKPSDSVMVFMDMALMGFASLEHSIEATDEQLKSNEEEIIRTLKSIRHSLRADSEEDDY